jgi:integrase/recombinase XerC
MLHAVSPDRQQLVLDLEFRSASPSLRRLVAMFVVTAQDAADISVGDALEMAIAHVRVSGGLTTQSLEKYFDTWQKFARFATVGHGLRSFVEVDENVAKQFIYATSSTTGGRPSPPTVQVRRSALRHLFRVLRFLRLVPDEPTVDIAVPARDNHVVRALTDDELERCRAASIRLLPTRDSSLVALAEVGATTAEIGIVSAANISIADQTVVLPGSTKVDSRVTEVTDWGLLQLTRRIDQVGLVVPLAYEGSGDEATRQSSIATGLRSILNRAGLGQDEAIEPGSFRAWFARQVWSETHDYAQVARALGCRSLDVAAHVVGHDWRNDGR